MMTTTDNRAADNPAEPAIIDQLIKNARQAMATIASADQARIDEWVTAVAWALYKPENAARLAELAVADTGLGNVADKIVKNRRKTLGTLRDLMRVRAVGHQLRRPEADDMRGDMLVAGSKLPGCLSLPEGAATGRGWQLTAKASQVVVAWLCRKRWICIRRWTCAFIDQRCPIRAQ